MGPDDDSSNDDSDGRAQSGAEPQKRPQPPRAAAPRNPLPTTTSKFGPAAERGPLSSRGADLAAILANSARRTPSTPPPALRRQSSPPPAALRPPPLVPPLPRAFPASLGAASGFVVDRVPPSSPHPAPMPERLESRRMRALVERVSDLRRAVASRDEEIVALKSQLSRGEGQPRLESEAGYAEASSEWRERTAELEAEQLRLEHECARLREHNARLEDELASRDAELATVRAALNETTRANPSERRPSRAEAGDDLTKIRGIGPAFSRKLRDLGITHFHHIAAWTEADLTDFAAKLGVSLARIQRADWIASARALASNAE